MLRLTYSDLGLHLERVLTCKHNFSFQLRRGLFLDLFELEVTSIKPHASYQELIDYGAIAS